MYNKIFTKILDSSIWLEPSPTRLIWLTFIAAMDEDGFAAFASVANLAHRARVELSETQAAVDALEAPDPNSSDPDNEGRRIERVPGGWMILNASKYRDLVTRTVIKEQTRARVARHRQSKKENGNAHVTASNGHVTQGNEIVTQSDTATKAETEAETEASPTTLPPASRSGVREGKDSDMIPTTEQSKRIAKLFHRRLTTAWTPQEVKAYRAIGTIPEEDLSALERYYAAHWPPKRDENILRHDLLTLLNKFPGEVDRARNFAAEKATNGHDKMFLSR